MIPLFVECSGRRIVIFGGGDVAARKCAYFTGAGADVTVLSRSFGHAITGLGIHRGELDVKAASDDRLRELIRGAFLVIAALPDPEENNRIGRICRSENILFNNADGEPGDVFLPAILAGQRYTIAISTGGASPAISRYIRERLENDLPGLDAMIALQESLRARLKETVPDQARRAAILSEVLANPAVWRLLEQDPSRAEEEVIARYIHG